MQKVYRLLRNNQETGPYTLEEILLLNLKPFDLVWVEGRSAAWRYPSEIDALKAFVPSVPQPQSPFEPVATDAMEATPVATPVSKTDGIKKVFVSMPEQVPQPTDNRQMETRQPTRPVIEQKTDIFSAPSPAVQIPEKESIQTKFSRPLNDVEEDYANWMYRQKAKNKTKYSKKDLAIAALIVALIIGGYFIISRPAIVQPVSGQRSTPVHPGEPVRSEIPQPGLPATEDKEQSDLKTVQKTKRSISSTVPTAPRGNDQEVGENGIQAKDVTRVEKENPVAETNNETIQTQKTPEGKEQKKKLGEVIRGIFTKKDKKENTGKETVEEEPQPATNRQATKRNADGEAGDETSNEALSNLIDISSNAPDNWMMGVNGLKLTIRNRNSVVLQTAAVQVLYFDENNQLLEKKSVYFNNVPAKGKATMAAPDHKFADHVEFKLLAVSAKADRYASN